MRKLDSDTWREVSPYVDEALDLPPAERGRWLDALKTTKPDIAAVVAALLDEDQAVAGNRFLEDAPELVATHGLAGTLVGGYQLVSPLGEGGMGSVWLAERHDGRYEGRAAIKFLNAGLMGHAVQQRFTREGSILAKLSHPNIARMIDAGVTQIGQPYIVLEYVDGEPIDRYCEHRDLSRSERVRLFLDVLAAVAHAHANLIVHRDLKPSNILVTADGQVRLLDFGIAKLLTDQPSAAQTQITRQGGGALTPAYAAPEQLTGGLVTTATDVYALGVLLYELVVGRHPFDDALATPAALLQATIHREPPLGTQSDLDIVLSKALKKAPDERYASVVELADDLRRCLNHEPISARADSLSYRAAKFVRRNRAMVSVTALAMLALVAGLVSTLVQARRATAQAAVAAAERDFAMRQLARAEAMNDLNHFLVTEAVPAGETFTVRELLARAEEAVAQQHADDPETRMDMLVNIGRQYWAQDDYTDSRRVLEAAYGLSPSAADPATKARAACAYSSVLSKFGEEERAEALIQEGLAHVTGREQDALVRAFCYLRGSESAREFGHSAVAIERAESAERIARASAVASPLFRLRVQLDVAESYRVASRLPDADLAFARAREELTRLGYGETETAETLFNNWALVLWQLGRPVHAERLYRRAIAISSADGTDARVSPFVLNNLARTLIDLGRYDEALEYASRAYEKAVTAGSPGVIIQTLFSRAAAHRNRGDLARLEGVAREIAERGAPMWSEGHPALVGLVALQGDLAAARGDFDTAATLMTRVIETAERNEDDYLLPRILLRRAHVWLARQQPDAARQDAERAQGVFEATAGPNTESLWSGRAAVLHAQALVMLDRVDQAREQLMAALQHFSIVGDEHPERQHAHQLLSQFTAARR